MVNFEPIRNWFGFTRRERRSSFILLLIVIFILILRVLIPEKNIDIEDITSSISEYNKLDTTRDLQQQSAGFAFDPNVASYDTLIRAGLTEREAKTLISYRNKGAKFKQPSDIKKVYGIEAEKVARLIPFVDVKTDTIRKAATFTYRQKRPLISLNNCDTATLMTLPGIGPVLSVRIIKYRSLLGGYISVDQLREVYGLPPETFDRIRTRVYADSSMVMKIKINSVGYKELSRIPYLEKYDVAAILKYRELNGNIESIGDLIQNKLLTPEKAKKVRPYLNFEKDLPIK
jgi:competence protein ComEA